MSTTSSTSSETKDQQRRDEILIAEIKVRQDARFSVAPTLKRRDDIEARKQKAILELAKMDEEEMECEDKLARALEFSSLGGVAKETHKEKLMWVLKGMYAEELAIGSADEYHQSMTFASFCGKVKLGELLLPIAEAHHKCVGATVEMNATSVGLNRMTSSG